MSGGMIWVKHYATKRTDPRVKLLSLPSKAVYYLLTEVAGQCDANGHFVMNGIQLTDAQIAHLATIEITDYKTAVREMKRTGLISVNGHGPYLTDFASEQTSQQQRREQWKARQERRRQQPQEPVTRDITHPVTRDVTPLELRVKSLEKESLLLLSQAEREKLNPGWSQEAALIAANADKPATYAKGILKNWIKEGKGNGNTKSGSGNAKRNIQSKGTTANTANSPAPTSADLEAARRALAKRKSKV